MKRIPAKVGLATWLLERLRLGSRQESLVGDLLEEVRSGRSAGWYWRQVLAAAGIAAAESVQRMLLPLFFSAAWSGLYPVIWPAVAESRWSRNIVRWMAERDWPYSSGLQAAGGILPLVLFVWVGCLVYLVLRNGVGRRISAARVLVGLSISFNVLWVGTVAESWSGLGSGWRDVPAAPLRVEMFAPSLVLASSLFSALLCALGGPRRGARSVAE